MTETVATQQELEGLVMQGDLILSTYGHHDNDEAANYKPKEAYGLPVYEGNNHLVAITFETTGYRLFALEPEAAVNLMISNHPNDEVHFTHYPRHYEFPPSNEQDCLVGEAFSLGVSRNRCDVGTYAAWYDVPTKVYHTEAFITLDTGTEDNPQTQIDVVLTSLASNSLHRLLACVPRIARG